MKFPCFFLAKVSKKKILSGVHSRALDGPAAAARLSIAFLSNKIGTHEKYSSIRL